MVATFQLKKYAKLKTKHWAEPGFFQAAVKTYKATVFLYQIFSADILTRSKMLTARKQQVKQKEQELKEQQEQQEQQMQQKLQEQQKDKTKRKRKGLPNSKSLKEQEKDQQKIKKQHNEYKAMMIFYYDNKDDLVITGTIGHLVHPTKGAICVAQDMVNDNITRCFCMETLLGLLIRHLYSKHHKPQRNYL